MMVGVSSVDPFEFADSCLLGWGVPCIDRLHSSRDIWVCLNSSSPKQLAHIMTLHPRPVLLARKAQALRSETGNSCYVAPIELEPPMSVSARAHRTVSIPFRMLINEPTLIATTIYMSVISLFARSNRS